MKKRSRSGSKPEDDRSRIHLRVSHDLKRAARVRAAQMGITMSELVRTLLRQETETQDLPL